MIQMLERVADPKIINNVTRMMEKEYGLVHNRDYHMTFVYKKERPPEMKIKLLSEKQSSSMDALEVSLRKIYDHSMVR